MLQRLALRDVRSGKDRLSCLGEACCTRIYSGDCALHRVMLFGDEYNGSKRWLSLGPLSFQPSEFAKVAVILFLAHVITKNIQEMGKMRTLLKIMAMILPIVGLVGASNLSTAIIILGIAVVLVFVASPKYGQFVVMGLLGMGFMGVFLALESYRLERIAIWRNPEDYGRKATSTRSRALSPVGFRGLVRQRTWRKCTEAGIRAGGPE